MYIASGIIATPVILRVMKYVPALYGALVNYSGYSSCEPEAFVSYLVYNPILNVNFCER